ncbi:MAG: hypothetical protein QOJ07_2491 [Thermoleophilaceae bacterium]|nr:hypothetical protein [Thermoleophilaceae bacterium]
MSAAIDVRRDFDGGPGFLNTASVGIPPRRAAEALAEATAEWARGRVQPPSYDDPVARSRAAFARLHGVEPGDVAIGPQVSYFVGLVASALPPGAEVIGYEGDFTSLLFPFLARDDLRVRLVPLDAVADAVSETTALVAISAVQSADGAVADLDAIESAAARHGARTLIDTTQSSGWLPLAAGRFDYVVAGAYKWLLSPRGSAFMALRPERRDELTPTAAGWYAGALPWESIYGAPLRLARDARRFDMSPAWLVWVGTAVALEYIEGVGIEAIHAHDVALANEARERLGLPPGESAIFAVAGDAAPDALAAGGVTAAVRAGQVRVSFHLYNSRDDVDALVRALGR